MLNPVRIGILVSSDKVHAFEASYIEDILGDERLQLVSVLQFMGDKGVEPQGFLWNKWAAKSLYPTMRANISRTLEDILGVHEKFPIHFNRKGKFSYYCNDESLETVRSLNLDVIISCQYRIIRGEFLCVPKAGVWSFHADDEQYYRGGPAGFWEIYKGDPINGAILQKLTDKLDAGIILRKGWFKTDLCSLSHSQDPVLFEASAWVKSALLELWNSPTCFSDREPSSTSAKIYHNPTNFQMLCFLAKIGFRKAVKYIRNFLFYSAWNIAIVRTPVEKLDVSKAEWFPECKWPYYQADPFGEPGRILLEEYHYKLDIGKIKTISLDSKNRETSRRNFIDSDQHHSYPFIFKSMEGDFVIPESLQRKKAVLYRLDTGAIEGELLEGAPVVDPSIHFDGKLYWLFCTRFTSFHDANASLFLFYSENLRGPYKPHLLNPVKSDIRCSRPAGSFFYVEGKLHRAAQDCSYSYGGAISIMRIEKLSVNEFEENVIRRIEPVAPYNTGLHHLTSFGDSACLIDGKRYAFSMDRIIWKIFGSRSSLNTRHLLPINSFSTLSIKSWHPYIVTKGIYGDGWCARYSTFGFEVTCEMKLTLHVEFPGWQTAKLQKIKMVANDATVYNYLKQGLTKINICLLPGNQQIRLKASKAFEMPSPDPRRCALRILEMEFSPIK